MNITLAFGCHL